METMLDIIIEDEIVNHTRLEKDMFLSLAETVVLLPKQLTSYKEWKKLSSSAKEIYRALLANYNYETGISQITHAQILNEAGIGGNATIVKSLNSLEESAYIVRVGYKTKNHCYLMPYQETFYSEIIGTEARDFLTHYKVIKKNKKSEVDNKTPHKLFFKACYNLINLGVENPDKIIEKYSDNGNILRIVLSMCDTAYIAKKHSLITDIDFAEYLKECLKKDNISEQIFDSETMSKVKSILRKNKEAVVEKY